MRIHNDRHARRDLIRPDEGESVAIGGVDVAFRVSGLETNGAYAIVEFRLEPGRLIPPHAHSHELEVSYVLEGEIGLRIGPEELTANQGCFVVMRPHVPHAWWNAATNPARVLAVISPAGFEHYFRELAEIHASRAPRQSQLIADLQDRYSLTAYLDWVAPLKTRHGLKLLGE